VASGQFYGDPSPGGSPSQGSDAKTHVDAAGDPFMPGSLKFDPAEVTVKMGGIVQWTNTDRIVPHTATEDHSLWDLAGDYGADPFPRGFGPGESRERVFEAGTQHYYCKVHPEQMRGVVRVPVELKVEGKKVKVKRRSRGRRRRRRTRTVYTAVVKWATTTQPGLVSDVQYRRAGGDWKTLREGSGETGASFRGGTKHGPKWEVRARLRAANSSTRATDWSPVASVTI
jgi:plastocyanin